MQFLGSCPAAPPSFALAQTTSWSGAGLCQRSWGQALGSVGMQCCGGPGGCAHVGTQYSSGKGHSAAVKGEELSWCIGGKVCPCGAAGVVYRMWLREVPGLPCCGLWLVCSLQPLRSWIALVERFGNSCKGPSHPSFSLTSVENKNI